MKTALVLAGAGARGVIQVGMIKAFVEMGFTYDLLYGSSVGAINGAMLHAGQLPELLAMWLNLKNKDVYTPAPWNAFIPGKASLNDSTPLYKLIKRTVNLKALLQQTKPFSAYATMLTAKGGDAFTSIYFRTEGQAEPTPEQCEGFALGLWASASPPVLFPPVQTKHGVLTDGGITNNYSIVDAVNGGADRIIVLSPMVPEPKPIRNIIDAIDTTISIQIYNQLKRELRFVEKLNDDPRYRKVDVTVISCEKPTGIGILDFEVKDKLDWIAYGYKLACGKLKHLEVNK